MEELVAGDIVFHGAGGPDDLMRGIDQGFRPFYRNILGAFPDIRFTVEAAVRDGDMEALRWTARMTHAGDHLGIPATQKPVTISGMVFARFANGKVAESWDNWDMMGLMKQIDMITHERIVPAQEA